MNSKFHWETANKSLQFQIHTTMGDPNTLITTQHTAAETVPAFQGSMAIICWTRNQTGSDKQALVGMVRYVIGMAHVTLILVCDSDLTGVLCELMADPVSVKDSVCLAGNIRWPDGGLEAVLTRLGDPVATRFLMLHNIQLHHIHETLLVQLAVELESISFRRVSIVNKVLIRKLEIKLEQPFHFRRICNTNSVYAYHLHDNCDDF